MLHHFLIPVVDWILSNVVEQSHYGVLPVYNTRVTALSFASGEVILDEVAGVLVMAFQALRVEVKPRPRYKYLQAHWMMQYASLFVHVARIS